MQREVYLLENFFRLADFVKNRPAEEKALDLGIGFFAAEQTSHGVKLKTFPEQIQDHLLSEIAQGALSPLSQDILFIADPCLTPANQISGTYLDLPTCRWLVTGLHYQCIGSHKGALGIDWLELKHTNSLEDIVQAFFNKIHASIMELRARQIFFIFDLHFLAQYFYAVLRAHSPSQVDYPAQSSEFETAVAREFVYWLFDTLLHPSFVVICSSSKDWEVLLSQIKIAPNSENRQNVTFHI